MARIKRIPLLDEVVSFNSDDLFVVHQGQNRAGNKTKKASYEQLVNALAILIGGGGGGTNGREIELTNDGAYIKWRYVGAASWTNLVALADITGDSAYEIAVANGFVGTEEEWLASLGSHFDSTQLAGYATTSQLSGYIPTSELSSLATTSQLSGYIPTDQISGFATTGQLNAYIPTSELSGLVTTSQISGFISSDQLSAYIPTSQASSFATTGQLSGYIPTDQISGFATTGQLGAYIPTSQISSFATTDQISGLASTGQLGGYATTEQLSGYATTDQLAALGSSSAITVATASGLALSSGVLSSIYNTTISDAINSVAVGGASVQAASVWKTKSLVEVFDAILFPDQLPTYTIPTLVLAYTQSGTKEIGSSVGQVMTLTGTENDAGAFTSLTIKRGGASISSTNSPSSSAATNIASQYGYSDPNNPNLKYTLDYTDTFTVVSGTTTWSGAGVYSRGLAKKNNKGVDDIRTASVRLTTAPQAAASDLVSSSVSVSGIYPYFWGKSSSQPTVSSISAAIQAGTTHKVLSDSNGTITITFDASGEYVWFAHASVYTYKTKWYNTGLNQGSIGAGQFILAPVQHNVTSPEGYWAGVAFEIYISSGATNTSGAYQLQN